MGLFRANETINANEHNMVKSPNWQEADSWLFSSVPEELN